MTPFCQRFQGNDNLRYKLQGRQKQHQKQIEKLVFEYIVILTPHIYIPKNSYASTTDQ